MNTVVKGDDANSDKEENEGSYRKREGEKRDDEEQRGSSRSKRSRGDDEEDNGRHRSSREKDREGSRDRERSSSKERRDRIDRDRGRSSSRSRREEERERDVVVERGSRRHRDKKDEPEGDPERDQRTVFAYQMPLKATERDVYEFFSKAGKVRDVRLIMDRNSRRSKGVGYTINAIMKRMMAIPCTLV